MNSFKKDLPLYLNGFAVTHLFLRTQCDCIDLVMFVIAGITFFGVD